MVKVSIIGLGKLGSPMAAVYASKSFEVIGVDKNPTYVEAINAGKAPVDEPQLQEFIDANKERLTATLDTKDAIRKT
ncbi:MAG: UDP-glucose/GDP-mannose dehydrogenase family protein, partial [Alphaproteobacteria bacterium]|nr:UDP-glucose/GDP-mannose dehydrogenase family protein [Alphaproteobacteria bacterium]